MTAEKIAQILGGQVVVGSDADVSEFYAGDFLSRVMGRAPSDSAWLTVMSNVNVAGVAVLAEIKIIVICEGVEPSPQLTEKCKEENIAIVTTAKGVYESCRLLG